MHRRTFVTAASLSAVGLAAPGAASAQGTAAPAKPAGERDVARHAQDAWYDALPSKHRLFVDATSVEEAFTALGFAFNFLRTSQTGYNLKDTDAGVIICLRHDATDFAFSNELWEQHEYFQKIRYKHPDTGKKLKGGNIYRVGSKRPESLPEGFTYDGLAKRGVHFAICGLATRAAATEIAGKGASREAIEDVMDKLVAGLPANAHVMASGILAAQRAGEYGYTVIRA